MLVSNKNDIKTILDSEITSRKILAIIKRQFNVNLPERGHLAGQAVSSAILEILFSDIKPIYNDIDIFYVINSESFRNSENFSELRNRQEKLENDQSVFSNISIQEDLYTQKNYVFSEISYQVKASIKQGPLNKTYISYFDNKFFIGNYAKYLTRRIIENFDINATQVGISLETMKISYTEEFIDFLLTKQLRIVRFNTPNHSLIRLAKKSEELSGTYVDFEEAKMLVFAYTHSFQNIMEVKQAFDLMTPLVDKKVYFEIQRSSLNEDRLGNIPLLFGEKYLKDYEKYFKNNLLQGGNNNSTVNYNYYSKDMFVGHNMNIYSKDHIFDKEKCLITNKHSSQLRVVLSNTPEIYFNKMLTFFRENGFKNKNFQKVESSMENLFFNTNRSVARKAIENVDSITKMRNDISFSNDSEIDLSTSLISIPKIYMSLKKTKKKSKKIFMNKSVLDNISKSCINNAELGLFTYAHELTENNIQYTQKHTMSILKKHNLSKYISILSLEEGAVFAKNLKIAKKRFGNFLFGVLETNNVDKHIILDIELFLSFLCEEKISFQKKLKENSFDFSNNDIEINEIISGETLFIEGEEMKHCVAGYSNNIKNGYSNIFKVYSKQKNLRCTIELCKRKSGKFYLAQIRGKFNRRVDFKSAKYALDILNMEYKTLFPLSRQSLICFDNVFSEEMKYFEKPNKNNCYNQNNLALIDNEFEEDNIPF